MLFLSITLHVVLAIGLTFAYFHRTGTPASLPSDAKHSSLVLVSSQIVVPEPQNLAPSKPAVSSMTPSLPQSESPVPSVAPHENLVAATQPAPSPVVEANPNANLPLPQPEAILSPTPPPALNSREGIVFLLDVSGSMYEPYAGSTRLMLARQELSRQIRSLKDGTPFAITIYAQTGRNSGPLVAASNATREAAVRFIMEDFDCGGGTNLPEGLASAQKLHAGHLILVSDGDLNINQADLLAEAQRILGAPGHNPALNIVAIGPRTSTDAERLLQGLADQQNGNYSVEQAGDKTALLTTDKSKATAP